MPVQVERYDPTTGQWKAVTSMLSKRCRLGAATFDGKLYVCGGYDGSTFLRTVEVYDPITSRSGRNTSDYDLLKRRLKGYLSNVTSAGWSLII